MKTLICKVKVGADPGEGIQGYTPVNAPAPRVCISKELE